MRWKVCAQIKRGTMMVSGISVWMRECLRDCAALFDDIIWQDSQHYRSWRESGHDSSCVSSSRLCVRHRGNFLQRLLHRFLFLFFSGSRVWFMSHLYFRGGGRLKTISGKTGGIVPYYDTRGTRAGKNHFKSTLFFKQTWKTEVDWMSHLFINIKKRINYIFFQKLKLTLHIVLLNINKCMFIPK